MCMKFGKNQPAKVCSIKTERDQLYLRFKHVCDSCSCTLQTNSTAKEDCQHNVRKRSSEVYSLRMDNIKHM